LHQFSSDYVKEAATKINQRIREILDLESAQTSFEYEKKQLNK